jgi:hypothetical protein
MLKRIRGKSGRGNYPDHAEIQKNTGAKKGVSYKADPLEYFGCGGRI